MRTQNRHDVPALSKVLLQTSVASQKRSALLAEDLHRPVMHGVHDPPEVLKVLMGEPLCYAPSQRHRDSYLEVVEKVHVPRKEVQCRAAVRVREYGDPGADTGLLTQNSSARYHMCPYCLRQVGQKSSPIPLAL